ncbi:MAG: dihydrofolate reductase [Clostridia bacterium]|nr:dihydrofolate reductase [Clostridia bacterium]
MKAIVCVSNNWGIGKDNKLIFSLKKDMNYFKEKTMNKIVVMGSNTLKSFPNQKPLKDRINIVLFPGDENLPGCIVVRSLDELFFELKKYNSDDTFIIGGAMFYKTMYKYCDTIYVTKVDAYKEADTFFPNLDDDKDWEITNISNVDSENGYSFNFVTYINHNPLKF